MIVRESVAERMHRQNPDRRMENFPPVVDVAVGNVEKLVEAFIKAD